MKLVRRVQRELEAGKDVFIEGGMPRKLELELETIQQEVRRLIGRSQALSQPTPLRQGLTEPCTPTKASCEPQPETVTPSCKFPGGTGRRRWRKCNDLGQFMDKPEEVMARPSTAPTSNTWVVRTCHRLWLFCIIEILQEVNHQRCFKYQIREVSSADWGIILIWWNSKLVSSFESNTLDFSSYIKVDCNRFVKAPCNLRRSQLQIHVRFHASVYRNRYNYMELRNCSLLLNSPFLV